MDSERLRETVAGLVRQTLEAEWRASAERQAVHGCGPSTSTEVGAATARDTRRVI